MDTVLPFEQGRWSTGIWQRRYHVGRHVLLLLSAARPPQPNPARNCVGSLVAGNQHDTACMRRVKESGTLDDVVHWVEKPPGWTGGELMFEVEERKLDQLIARLTDWS